MKRFVKNSKYLIDNVQIAIESAIIEDEYNVKYLNS